MAQEIVIIGEDGQEHVFPAGFDPKRAAGIVRGGSQPTKPTGGMAGFGNAMLTSSSEPVIRPAETVRGAAKFAPAAGAAIGGLLGGIPGAVLGGGAGEAVGQLANRAMGNTAPLYPAEAALAIGGQGIVGGATEGAGRLITGIAAPAGRWAMNRALNLTDKMAGEFPDMAQTMLNRGISVSRGGISKARGLLRTAKGQANQVLGAIDASGQRIPRTAATDALSDVVTQLPATGDPIGGLSRLATLERQMTRGHAQDFSGTEADALKAGLQREAKQFYASARGSQGRPALNVIGSGKTAMARGLNDALEQTGTAVGAPGYQAANQRAQEMIGAIRGISRAVRPGGSGLLHAAGTPAIGATLGGAAGYQSGHPGAGAAIGAAAGTPQGLSLIARGLAGPAGQQIIRQLPRVGAAGLSDELRAALLAALNGQAQQ